MATTIITPNRRGHDANKGATNDSLEEVSSKPDLLGMKTALEGVQRDAEWYFSRNENAFDAWHARWDGQTVDGRRWSPRDASEDFVFPWPGASDTRVRTVEKIVGQRVTVAMFAIMNMKLQAKSTQPFRTIRESQQATTLLNWMFYTHMGPENRRELSLGVTWREAYGASVLGVCWDQERRLDYMEVTVPQIVDYINQQGAGSMEQGAAAQQQPPLMIDEFAGMLADEAMEDQMIQLVQSFSPILSRPQARAILKDLRELRYAEIPVPYVFKSRPRLDALRPMVDVLFPWSTDNLQRARWIDRIEWVTETELNDRIDTAGYDPAFVKDAIDHKGQDSGSSLWSGRTAGERASFTGPGGRSYDDFEQRIQLHHFYRKAHDRGVPILECTVFHESVETEAKHGPYEYQHGDYPFHEMRREYHERPILSSRGIPEIAHSWELEIKAQRDARTDRTELALKPPLLAPYQDVLRLKQSFSPSAILPERRAGDMRFMPPPQYDPGSVEIERSLQAATEEFFGLFGESVDPSLKQLRSQELADEILTELKPVVRQVWQLLQQYLPDADVARVVGPLARPFHVDRHEIEGAYELSATVDMRDKDPDFLKEKLGYMIQLANIDTMGLLDKAAMLKIGAEAVDYSLADMAVQDQEPATEKEVQDEQEAIARVIGSGLDQPVPRGANYQLRLQTLMTTVQEALQTNPATRKIVGANPDILKVLEKRAEFYQNQLQQQKNAQIGRMVSTKTFSNEAPAAQAQLA